MSAKTAGYALLLVLFALAAPAMAAPKGDDDRATSEAREHVGRAKVHFKLQEWDDAVKEWKEAYRLKPVPLLLFNIAQASRMGGHYRQSELYYENFLRDMPDAPNREEVKKQLAQLEELVARVGDEEVPAKAAKPEPVKPAEPVKEKPKEAAKAAPKPVVDPLPNPPPPPKPVVPPLATKPAEKQERPALPAQAVEPAPRTEVASAPGKSRVLTYALGAAAGVLGIAAAVEYGRARAGWSDAVSTERPRPELDRRIADADHTWSLSLGLGGVALAAGAGAALTFVF